jgi:hypothetical protein
MQRLEVSCAVRHNTLVSLTAIRDACAVSRSGICMTSNASLKRYSAWNRKNTTLFDGHYLRNRSTLDIGVLGYIGIV